MSYNWAGMQKLSYEEVKQLHMRGDLCGCFFLYDDNSESTIFAPYIWEDVVKHYENGGEFGIEYNNYKEKRSFTMKRIEVVAAIIRHEDKIFATQRGYGDFKDGWEFPGGKMEAGETPQQALVREIQEELDTEVEVGELIETVEYDYPQFHLTMHCFWCTIKSGDLVLKEHEAAQWLTKETLDSVEWLPADKGLIEHIRIVLE